MNVLPSPTQVHFLVTWLNLITSLFETTYNSSCTTTAQRWLLRSLIPSEHLSSGQGTHALLSLSNRSNLLVFVLKMYTMLPEFLGVPKSLSSREKRLAVNASSTSWRHLSSPSTSSGITRVRRNFVLIWRNRTVFITETKSWLLVIMR